MLLFLPLGLCLTCTLSRVPLEGAGQALVSAFSCSSRGTRAQARKLAHLSQSVPHGYRNTKRWAMASGAGDQGLDLLTNFCSSSPPGTEKRAPREAAITSSRQAKFFLRAYIKH